MSGALGQAAVIPVTSLLQPKHGPQAVTFKLQWQNGNPAAQVINLQQFSANNLFDTVQSLYVDNTRNPFALNIYEPETQFTFQVAAFSDGMYPVVASSSPRFIVSIPAFAVQPVYTFTTTLIFLNVPMQPYQNNDIDNFQGSFVATLFMNTGTTSLIVFNAAAALFLEVTSLRVNIATSATAAETSGTPAFTLTSAPTDSPARISFPMAYTDGPYVAAGEAHQFPPQEFAGANQIAGIPGAVLTMNATGLTTGINYFLTVFISFRYRGISV
jgi:hypothetical protein